MRRMRPGFTLIELLVVLAIMGLVLAIVLPAVLKAPQAAKLEKARTEVANLDMALKAYEREYKVWPTGIAAGEFTPDMLNVLCGTAATSTDKKRNPYKRSFLEAGALSVNSAGTLVDPWDNPYKYAVDDNFDNIINGADGGTVTGRATAVWSPGDPATSPQKSVRSW